MLKNQVRDRLFAGLRHLFLYALLGLQDGIQNLLPACLQDMARAPGYYRQEGV